MSCGDLPESRLPIDAPLHSTRRTSTHQNVLPLLMFFLFLTFVRRPREVFFGACDIPKCTIGIPQVRGSSNLHLSVIVVRHAERFLIVLYRGEKISISVLPESHLYVGMGIVWLKSQSPARSATWPRSADL